MQARWLSPLVVLTVATLLAFAPAARAQWDGAVPLTLAGTGDSELSTHESLSVDDFGGLHVVYRVSRGPGGGSDMYYRQRFPDGDWTPPVQINTYADTAAAYDLAGAVSPTGLGGASFVQNTQVMYSQQGDFGWFSIPITQADGRMNYTPSIVMDEAGWFHITWVIESQGVFNLGYAGGDAGNWDVQMIQVELGDYGSGATPRIAVAANGAAHIVYRGGNYPNYRVHHVYNATRGGTDWTNETVGTTNLVDLAADFEIDQHGDYHIAIFGNDGFGFPGRIYYRFGMPDVGWQTQELVSGTFSAVEPELVLDALGGPHVVWAETSGNFFTGHLYYSFFEDEVGWQSVHVVGDDYRNHSFGIDHMGYGELIYSSGADTGVDDVFHLESTEPLATAVPEPRIDFRPEFLDFDSVLIGEDSTQNLTATNVGTDDLVVLTVEVTDGYSSDFGGAVQIEPGDSVLIAVMFEPIQAASYEGVLVVSSNANSSPDSIGLGGIGYEPPPAPIVDIDPQALNFDSMFVGGEITLPLTVTNVGELNLVLDSTHVSSTGPFSTDFFGPLVLNPDSWTTINVTFAPTEIGWFDESMLLISNASTSPDAVVLTGRGYGFPVLDLDRDALDFGTVLVGEDSAQAVILTNVGTATLTLGDHTVPEGFSVEHYPRSMSPATSVTLTVHFAPTQEQVYDGYFVIESDAESSPDSVHLTGIGDIESAIPDPSTPIPTSSYLAQNFPNPFNTSTRIEFGLSEASVVRVSVSDILGREVVVLVEGRRSAGVHRLDWSCDGCADGVYFVRLETGESVEIRKAVFLK